MQATRERILHILKEREEATVDQLSQQLGLTPVTIRHHLEVLRGEGLISAPIVRRRRAPGRPQHVYMLTEVASAYFPKQYDQLACLILDELRERIPRADIEQMMEHIGQRLATQFQAPAEAKVPDEWLGSLVTFLNGRGYLASWEAQNGHYLLHIANCPYEQVAMAHPEVCGIDSTMLKSLLGTAPRRKSWAVQGDRQCTYLLRFPLLSGDGKAPLAH